MSVGVLTTLPLFGLSGVHLLPLRSGSWRVRVLGSLYWAMGAEGLRHLDDCCRLPPACLHHYHMSGNTGSTGPILNLHGAQRPLTKLTLCRQHYPTMKRVAWIKCCFVFMVSAFGRHCSITHQGLWLVLCSIPWWIGILGCLRSALLLYLGKDISRV